jgi:hypothetical protein
MISSFHPLAAPSESGGAPSPRRYQKILFRLKHLKRPIATWMETFDGRKLPAVGDLLKIPDHLQRLPGIGSFETDAVVIDVSSTDDLLVIYLAVRPRQPR